MSNAALSSLNVAPSGPKAARLAISFSRTNEKTFALSPRIRFKMERISFGISRSLLVLFMMMGVPGAVYTK